MRAPDFLVVGAHKAGTTSILDSLAQHPKISAPTTKEPHYFCAELVLSLIHI